MRPNRIKTVLNGIEPEVVDRYDGLMIVSGNMADTEAYWRNDKVLGLFDRANLGNKQLAAICCSVPTVRNVAAGKKVSYFPLVRSAELLRNAGAILQTVALTRDQNLVTAEHQMATQMWAEEFCNMLEGKPPEHILRDSGYTPQGNERKPIPVIEQIKKAKRSG